MKHESRCPTCLTSPRIGLLPVGTDWLECPDCDATGVFVCYEHLITPARHILMPGTKGH
jgi:hypothetical protein